MSESLQDSGPTTSAPSQVRPLSVPLTAELRAQLDILAQVNDRSVTKEVQDALEQHVERSRSDSKVLARAAAIKAEIEHEASKKREAIASIFDSKPDKPAR